MNVVEIKDLVKRYEKVVALNNINLNIQEGIIYGLLGPNGSGKSTLINILSGILRFDKGQCNIFGKDIKSNKKYIRKNIGIVTQEYSFYDDLKLEENLEFFGKLYGLSKKDISSRSIEILEKLDLKEYRNKYPTSFSGGMKRRVNIACSLIHNPKILIMDEPTASLDPVAREYVLNVVKNINKEGCTVIYTSHYLDEVYYLCHRVAILNNGIIIAEGSTDEINNLFKKKTIINIEISLMNDGVIKKLSNIKNEVLFLSDINISLDKIHSEIHIECSNPSIVLEKVLPYLRKNKILISDIDIKKSTFEETFIRLVNK